MRRPRKRMRSERGDIPAKQIRLHKVATTPLDCEVKKPGPNKLDEYEKGELK